MTPEHYIYLYPSVTGQWFVPLKEDEAKLLLIMFEDICWPEWNVSHGPELLVRGVSQCLGGMFTPGANKNYQTFTPISLIGFQGGVRGL